VRRTAIVALLTMLAAALAAPAPAAAAPAETAGASEHIVLYDHSATAADAQAAVAAAGGTILAENAAVGVATVSSDSADFAEQARSHPAIAGVARNRSIGSVPADPGGGLETLEHAGNAAADAAVQTAADAEPLAGLQWGMDQIGATVDGSYATERGSPEVLVGILDTGVDASHPDIAPNFNHELSRNFTVDIPTDADGNEIDGPCEFEDCVDPPDVDHNGHGTHVAGIVGAAFNGVGVAGVAPDVSLVNLRVGHDSGYFFLQSSVDALTYAGDNGIDVVNMSYFIDPWLWNCRSNPADSPEEQAEQAATIDAVQRAVDYASERGVTLISSAGNELYDVTKPQVDADSPNFVRTPGETPHERQVDPEDCVVVPTGSDGVLSISATGPSGRKSFYSNFGLGAIVVAAPGGDSFDNAEQASNPADAILSTYPEEVLRAEELLDEEGNPLTPAVVRDESGAYYAYLQGTSMAGPHAVGVAALIVSAFGDKDKEHGGLTLDPGEVEKRLRGTATPTPCPDPPEFTYTRNVVDPETGETEVITDTHVCEGDAGDNGFFGSGVVSAANAVSSSH
jgi:subtilisin family serine protease